MTATSTVDTGDHEKDAPVLEMTPQPAPQPAHDHIHEPEVRQSEVSGPDGPEPQVPDSEVREADGLGLPFAWEHGPHGQVTRERNHRFRFPAADDTGPGQRRLLAMALYTAMLGLAALAVTVRGVIAIMTDSAPSWFQPAFAGAGLVGFASVVGAFMSIHRPRMPWLLLGFAAIPLAVNVLTTKSA